MLANTDSQEQTMAMYGSSILCFFILVTFSSTESPRKEKNRERFLEKFRELLCKALRLILFNKERLQEKCDTDPPNEISSNTQYA